MIQQAWLIGQGVRLTMKYDGLTAEAGGVTCFQTLHLEVIYCWMRPIICDDADCDKS